MQGYGWSPSGPHISKLVAGEKRLFARAIAEEMLEFWKLEAMGRENKIIGGKKAGESVELENS
jgi:hypothetical protein